MTNLFTFVHCLYRLLRRNSTPARKFPYDFPVGIVYRAAVNGGQVDGCGLFRSVPHGRADDGEADAVCSGGGGPAVPGGVGGQAAVDAGYGREPFQQAVVVAQHGPVSAIGIRSAVPFSQNGEYVGRAVAPVSLHYRLHESLQPYVDPLSGLVAAVSEPSAADVAFPQAGHVYECHTSGAVAEQEQVAGHGQGGGVPERCPVEGGDRFLADGPLRRSFNTGVDVAERVVLAGLTFVRSLIIGRAEYPHIEGQGVAADSPSVQPARVLFHEAVRDGAHRYVPASEEGRQTVGGAEVVVGCAVPPVGLHGLACVADVLDEMTGFSAFPEEPGNVISGIGPVFPVEVSRDVPEQALTAFYFHPDVGQAAFLLSVQQPFPLVRTDADI